MPRPRCRGGGWAGVAERVRVTTKVEASVHVAEYSSPIRLGAAALVARAGRRLVRVWVRVGAEVRSAGRGHVELDLEAIPRAVGQVAADRVVGGEARDAGGRCGAEGAEGRLGALRGGGGLGGVGDVGAQLV
eukprot:scaffold78229_cov47-Phaeocystis_antarctica.AAC.1